MTTPTPAPTAADAAGHLVPTYARGPVQFDRGEGAIVWATDGTPYLDFLAGIAVSALGHGHPRLVRELTDQMGRLIHLSNLWAHPLQLEVAASIARACGLSRVFFTNSGTEAIEACLKMARKHRPGRPGIVALEGAFHGRTLGALSITHGAKYRAPFEPLIPGVRFVPREDLGALAAAVGEQSAALVLEPIQGEGGIVELSASYLREARRLCDATGTLLVHDEVQCGLGRTGTFLAAQAHGVVPDLVALAKPIAAGLPMGCAVASEEVALSMQPGDHGSTFAGGPMVCRAARVVLDELLERGLLEQVRAKGERLARGLRSLASERPCIREVRGRGLMLGLALDRPAKPLVQTLFDHRLIVNATAEDVIRFLPPFVVTDEQIDRALAILAQTLPRDSRRELDPHQETGNDR